MKKNTTALNDLIINVLKLCTCTCTDFLSVNGFVFRGVKIRLPLGTFCRLFLFIVVHPGPSIIMLEMFTVC